MVCLVGAPADVACSIHQQFSIIDSFHNQLAASAILPFKDKFNLSSFPFRQNKLYLFIPKLNKK